MGNEARHLDHVIQSASGVLQERAQIGESLSRLREEALTGHLACGGIDAGLPGGVDEIADAHRLGIRPEAGHAVALDDGFLAHAIVLLLDAVTKISSGSSSQAPAKETRPSDHV